jgi:hypothetical protein
LRDPGWAGKIIIGFVLYRINAISFAPQPLRETRSEQHSSLSLRDIHDFQSWRLAILFWTSAVKAI